jgi:hypothetical protein
MKHPYQQSVHNILKNEDVPKYEMTLKMCTLYKDRPYGPAHIELTIPNYEFYSFEGVGIFTDGELHMGPFTFIDGIGYVRSFSNMINGRPADGEYATYFECQGRTEVVDDLDEE